MPRFPAGERHVEEDELVVASGGAISPGGVHAGGVGPQLLLSCLRKLLVRHLRTRCQSELTGMFVEGSDATPEPLAQLAEGRLPPERQGPCALQAVRVSERDDRVCARGCRDARGAIRLPVDGGRLIENRDGGRLRRRGFSLVGKVPDQHASADQ